jgi:hypothetical protein
MRIIKKAEILLSLRSAITDMTVSSSSCNRAWRAAAAPATAGRNRSKGNKVHEEPERSRRFRRTITNYWPGRLGKLLPMGTHTGKPHS